jgi:hypothetical protein
MMVNQIRAKNGIPYDSLRFENALELIGRSGTRFQFRWTDRWGTWIAYLALSDDYRSFSGSWTIRNSVEGEWTGQRRSP